LDTYRLGDKSDVNGTHVAGVGNTALRCMTREQRIAAQNAKDDQKCLSFGARPGSDAYVNCCSQLAGARTTAAAIEDAAPPPAQPTGPVTCMKTGTMVTCN
jgi:hypothetical protein